jgi:hypothetical protein
MRDAKLFNIDSKVSDVIFKICSMPSDSHIYTNKSMVKLTKESGYLEYKDFVTKDRIIRTLKENPDFIYDWLGYSEDQRITYGWAFQFWGGDKWTVGLYNTQNQDWERNYTDGYEACATFILIEVDSFATNPYINKC